MTVKTSISLTDSQEAFARNLVERGRYPSLSAVLQHGLETVNKEGFSAVYMLDERTQFNTEIIVGSGAKSNGRRPASDAITLAQPLTPNDALAASLGGNGRNGSHATPPPPPAVVATAKTIPVRKKSTRLPSTRSRLTARKPTPKAKP